ncbi:MAG: hypothetical protein MMC23_005383 [Stictis urceolatum]|nr:hypothetical protein [Stictis urceolata]
MHTLPPTRVHLPYCSTIAASAFSTAPHYLYLRPYHTEFPERAYIYYLRKITIRFVSPNTVIRTALSDDSDAFYSPTSGSQPIGYAIWTRTWGSDEVPSAEDKETWGTDSTWNKLERWARGWRVWYEDLAMPDPAAAPERAKAFNNVGKQFEELMRGELDKQPEGRGYVFLQALAVEPELHRRGIGGRLLRWGLERSEREGVPIFLAASVVAMGLYEKFGWKKVGNLAIDMDGESWGDAVMVRWPKGRVEEVEKVKVDEEVIEKAAVSFG